jgi:hypothetical protein
VPKDVVPPVAPANDEDWPPEPPTNVTFNLVVVDGILNVPGLVKTVTFDVTALLDCMVLSPYVIDVPLIVTAI